MQYQRRPKSFDVKLNYAHQQYALIPGDARQRFGSLGYDVPHLVELDTGSQGSTVDYYAGGPLSIADSCRSSRQPNSYTLSACPIVELTTSAGWRLGVASLWFLLVAFPQFRFKGVSTFRTNTS